MRQNPRACHSNRSVIRIDRTEPGFRTEMRLCDRYRVRRDKLFLMFLRRKRQEGIDILRGDLTQSNPSVLIDRRLEVAHRQGPSLVMNGRDPAWSLPACPYCKQRSSGALYPRRAAGSSSRWK